MADKQSTVRVAVVQASAVPFDSDACVEKAVRLIGNAAATGAKVVVFPEAFVGGYPKGLGYGLVVGARDAPGKPFSPPTLISTSSAEASSTSMSPDITLVPTSSN